MDEALTIVSKKLLKIKNDYGSESIWPYYYAGTMGLLQRDSIIGLDMNLISQDNIHYL